MAKEPAPQSGAEIPKVYKHQEVERRLYEWWEQQGYFTPRVDNSKKPFCITIPPPNVTGELHLGHALCYEIQDIVGRWRRMQGYNTLILPGTDHAGIGTQNVVERVLAKEGLTRHDVGREKFLERVWEWKEKYGNAIEQQFRNLGFAFDWTRNRFTMDAGYADAVLEFFVRLYEKGYIYRGERVINWCVRCHSAISDLEVEHVESSGNLYYLRYPFKDGSGDVVVATTRPETMLGDTAVAVNPTDDRYSGIIGKTAILPLMGRELPIIADHFVDPAFGTGAVKITPAHDPNDFEAGQRHNLPSVQVIGSDGIMTEAAGSFAGLDRYAARDAVLDALRDGGYVIKIEPHLHSVGTCERCGTVIEPMVSKQWFMRMGELARPAIEVVRSGQVKFIPDRWTGVYLDWMENIRDWCVSRQIWWGHRIPAWYCRDCGEVIVSKITPSACPKCRSDKLEQDPDVLDTWFSSALWPFATLGWPAKTPELEYFYPTSLMVTSSQIIFLWVSRMIMTGLEFMGEIPFPEVFINATILNSEGRRMSKSLGTGVDPLETTEKYGTDGTRFGLIIQAGQTQEVRFTEEKVEQGRNFANKIWNISRLVLSLLGDRRDTSVPERSELNLADRWVLSRLSRTTEAVTTALETFNLNEGLQSLYDFFWAELADWYMEAAKIAFYGEDEPARNASLQVSRLVLDEALRLLHPFMPFITEEIWQHLPHEGQSIMVAAWPESRGVDADAERDFDLVMGIVKAVRTARSEAQVEANRWIDATVKAGDRAPMLLEQAPVLSRLARLNADTLQIVESVAAPPENAMTLVVEDIVVYLPLAGMVDLAAERARLMDEISRTQSDLARTEAMLANEGFLNKAPADLVANTREKLRAAQQRVDTLQERLNAL